MKSREKEITEEIDFLNRENIRTFGEKKITTRWEFGK